MKQSTQVLPILIYAWSSVAGTAFLGCSSASTPEEPLASGGRSSSTDDDSFAGHSSSNGGTGANAGNGSTDDLAGPTIGKCPVFPADNAWNQDVSDLPVHANSSAYINSIGATGTLHPDFGTVWDGAPIGIPYSLVNGIPKVPIEFVAYGDESDPGPYPIPTDAQIEGGPDSDGDRHVLAIDEADCTLYELYRAFSAAPRQSWEADSGAVWNLRSNAGRTPGWTSADAAGLPIFPGLARYDEVVERGEVLHALRVTVKTSRRAYIAPASHAASNSTDPKFPPMGLRLRLRASYDCSSYSPEVQVLCRALKRFGLIVADNGSSWYVSGAPDPRWSDDNLNDLKTIPGSAFEAVETGTIVEQ